MQSLVGRGVCAMVVAAACASAHAGQVGWIDWQTESFPAVSGAFSGAFNGVTATFTGEVGFAQTSGGTNFWTPAAPYICPIIDNAPPDSDIVAISSPTGVQTLTFSEAVLNPVLGIVSLGSASNVTVWNFDAPFLVLSSGEGFMGGSPSALWHGPNNQLHGSEGHGAIQFVGTFTSISWTVVGGEFWAGFTVGIVPSPAAAGVLGAGLLTLARRRR